MAPIVKITLWPKPRSIQVSSQSLLFVWQSLSQRGLKTFQDVQINKITLRPRACSSVIESCAQHTWSPSLNPQQPKKGKEKKNSPWKYSFLSDSHVGGCGGRSRSELSLGKADIRVCYSPPQLLVPLTRLWGHSTHRSRWSPFCVTALKKSVLLHGYPCIWMHLIDAE